MPSLPFRQLLLLLGLCVGLAACDSAEERAAAYFASAQSLIAEGDLDRATIELRNVFELMPNHVEAREIMAELMLQRGDRGAAYGQYLRLVEQVPEHVTGRTVLAELAFAGRDWEEFSRHAAQVELLAPEAPRSRVIALARRYRDALDAKDGPARDALRQRAEDMAEAAPDSDILQQVLFDAYLRDGRLEKALVQLERMLARHPDNRAFHAQRLALLEEQGAFAEIEQQLREMVTRFADDPEPKTQLIQFLLARGEPERAEAFLRDIADPTAEEPTLFIDLVRFVHRLHGVEAARAELRAALDVAADPDRLRIVLAVLDFEDGAQDEAVTALQALLARSEEGSEQANRVRLTLARMLIQTGDEAAARSLVAEAIESDAANVEALKMQAVWMIRDDDTDGAVAALRLALDNAPDDVAAIGLMADAHARAGDHDLSREFLALAVEASDYAPAPTLRHAKMLASDERYIAAEEVLISALRRAPDNVDILVLLGEIYLASEDYGRADQVIRSLRRAGTERTRAVADALQARLLGSREGMEQALGYLRELVQREDASLGTEIALLRARLGSGRTSAALTQAERLVAENPANVALRFILATTHAANGDLETAEALTAGLLEEDPARARVWVQLYRLQRLQGRREAARQTLRDGLAALPDNRDLLWAQAAELEAAGEIDAAIARYEQLYARNSEDLVAANNLASLLATHTSDDANLERAWTVARRLRDTDVPALQDTYGWILFRRGAAQDALPYLESAAAGLPDDPVVQVRLAQVYAALDRRAAAIAQYRRALELGEGDPHPQMATARAEIARLEALPPAGE